MRYPWKVEAMRKYVERRGEEFRRDLFDRTISQRDMQKKHGVHQSQVSLLRTGLVPRNQRRLRAHDVTPQMLKAFESKATNQQLAERFAIPYPTLERMRRRHVGVRGAPEIRLTPQVMALLRSSLSNRRAAIALNANATTVWEYRIKLRIRLPKVQTMITEEQRAILASSKSYCEAAKHLSMSKSSVRRWFFLVEEGLL